MSRHLPEEESPFLSGSEDLLQQGTRRRQSMLSREFQEIFSFGSDARTSIAPSPFCLPRFETSVTRRRLSEIPGILTQSEQFQADRPSRASSSIRSPRLIRVPETRPENRRHV